MGFWLLALGACGAEWKLQYWVDGTIRVGVRDKMEFILYKPTIPSFHYSRLRQNPHL
jgi:hypothetical protein